MWPLTTLILFAICSFVCFLSFWVYSTQRDKPSHWPVIFRHFFPITLIVWYSYVLKGVFFPRHMSTVHTLIFPFGGRLPLYFVSQLMLLPPILASTDLFEILQSSHCRQGFLFFLTFAFFSLPSVIRTNYQNLDHSSFFLQHLNLANLNWLFAHYLPPATLRSHCQLASHWL